MLSRPWLLWVLAAIFWGRTLLLDLTAPNRSDGQALLAAGRALLRDPARLYEATAATIARTGYLPVNGLLGPPAGALLAAPFALLPPGFDMLAWSLGNLAAMVAAIYLLYRLTAPSGWHRPLFWLVAGFFPQVGADLAAGQLGGFLLLAASGAMVLMKRRPWLAGALAGASAAVKLYPAAMAIGAGSARFTRFVGGAVLAGLGLTAIAFLPLGWSGPRTYVTGVLIPALGARDPDCAVTSVRTFYARLIGGEAYPMIVGDGHMVTVTLPLHLGGVVTPLYLLTVVVLVGAAVLAGHRSGWAPGYSLAPALALGALIPGEVNIYQQLPLLPLLLLTLVRAAEARRAGPLVLIAVGLAAMLRQPCYSGFPDLWTLGALALYGAGVWAADLFKEDGAWLSTTRSSSHGSDTERGGSAAPMAGRS